jgi:class 3 adenylate cyclase
MAQSHVVTLLFSDLVDSTVHLQQVGDEAGAHLFQTLHKLLGDAISAHGGDELEWLGDGVLAAFQSTADAVRCAIDIEQSARRPLAGRKFEIRIGIHLGEVLRRDSGYFGTPVVTARRLCDLAASGQILCSRLVADVLSSRQAFSFRDLGALKLKGIAAGVEACEVVYERIDLAGMFNRTPFVGRAAQLERLSAALQNAERGRGSIVLLRGEPGIGKSRLLEEFCDHSKERGAIAVRGACYDGGESQAPYGPFAEAIVEYARLAPTNFAQLVAKCAAILSRIAPSILDSMEVPELPPADKEEERFRLFNAVSQFFADASQEAPLLLVLDDLHWADRGTAAMLGHVARNLSNNSFC